MSASFTPNTKTTIAVLISVVGCTAMLVLYMERRFSSVERSVELVSLQVVRLEAITVDRVSFSQVQNWIENFSDDNPTLKVKPLRK